MTLLEQVKGLIVGRKRPLHFASNVPATKTEKEEYTLTRDATIEDLRVRFYPGQELDLHIEVYVLKKDNDTRVDLVEYTGDKNYIAGDDDKFPFDISQGVQKDDKIVVKAENNDSTYAYDYVVNMSLDEVGGIKRVL